MKKKCTIYLLSKAKGLELCGNLNFELFLIYYHSFLGGKKNKEAELLVIIIDPSNNSRIKNVYFI